VRRRRTSRGGPDRSSVRRARHACHVRALFALALFVAAFLSAPRAHAVSDPSLEYWTLETARFHIHYEKGLEPVAVRVAELCESIHAELSASMGHVPDQITEVVLTDDTDSANGSATAVPFNTIRLYVTAPDDMSPLGDYDDWYLDLVTHEYTHILHTDNISGAASVINALLGKTLAPNQIQPRWVLEGLAVVKESEHSSAGRLRSSLFDMYIRADVVADNIAGLDQLSSGAQRWPQGNLYYLYGSRFLAWIGDVYGPNTMRAVSADYGGRLAPWAINRSIRRATGRTYTELYVGFQDYLRRRNADITAEVERRGRREGTRLTHHGYQVAYPRFVPNSAKGAAAGEALIYYRNDQHARPGLYQLPLGVTEPEEQLVARTNDITAASYGPDGALYFDSAVPQENVYSRHDLFALAKGERSEDGDEPARRRLTVGARAANPDVAPDGRSVVFTVNARGTSYLQIAELAPEGHLRGRRTLVPSARYEQAYTPRFSPDGRRVAYSVWSSGGYRDIRVVDVATGAFQSVTRDRALDMQPTWSSDGKTLYFASDRGGVFNIYAHDVASGRLAQVTNVVLGALQPAVSADGRTLAYVGYTTAGFDLYTMPLDRSRFLEPLPPPSDRPDPPTEPSGVHMVRRPYQPLPTLAPRNYTFEYKPSAYGGNALTLMTTGSDVVGHHAFSLRVTAGGGSPEPTVLLDYAYGRLPFNTNVRLFHSVSPRQDYRISDARPPYDEYVNGITTGVSYPIVEAFGSHNIGLSYTMAHFSGALPVGTALDPYASPTTTPPQGTLGLVHVGYGYSNAEGSSRSAGAARGASFGVGLDLAAEETGSTSTLRAFDYAASVYFPMPWLAHTVALRSAGAISAGTYSRSGIYAVGGYDLENNTLLDGITSRVFEGAFVLRGYPAGSYRGRAYLLDTLEYRFPIAVVDRGVATLPGFLRRIDGALFTDWGGAFNDLDLDAIELFRDGYLIDSPQLHTSVGGELWANLTLGYYLTTQLRFGYAYGFSREADEVGRFYFVAAGAF
jgi:hypothetical protein